MKRLLQSVASGTQQVTSATDIPHQPYHVGDVLPVRLGVPEMCRIFQVSPSQFHRLQRAGKFDRFEILPKIGHRAWSGSRVQAYLNGDASSRFIRRSA